MTGCQSPLRAKARIVSALVLLISLAGCGGSDVNGEGVGSEGNDGADRRVSTAPASGTEEICSLRWMCPPSARAAPARTSISMLAHGAVCDGKFDNTKAIASAISAARATGSEVHVPDGVCAYGNVIRLDGVKLVGMGDASVLYALDWSHSAIFMYGDGVELRSLRLAGAPATARRAAWEATRITLFAATNFVIDNLTIDGSAAAGIQTARAASHGRITNNRLRDTLANAIHITDQASYIEVSGNRIENSRDDGISVVSYRNDSGRVHHITARHNVVLNNRGGRMMSVVGGNDVLYEYNLLDTNLAGIACLFIAQDNRAATRAAENVVVQRNTLRNCGSTTTGHSALMLYSDGQESNRNISLIRNDLQPTGGAAGIRIFGANIGVVVDSNRITGAQPALNISTPAVTVVPFVSGTVGAL